MPAETAARTAADTPLSEAETIALAYYQDARRDGWAALVRAIEDALSDLDTAEAVIRERGRDISHGYVRGRA